MTAFRALVVDNDKDVRDKALQADNPEAGVHVLVAKSMPEAIDLVVEHFFHLAVVDLELSTAHRELAEGQTVLRSLLAGRPSCRRILLTKYTADMPEKVFDLLDPVAPVLYGAIDKGGFRDYFDSYLRNAAEDWSRAPVQIQNLDEIYEMLAAKRIRGREVLPDRRAAVTCDELDFVLKKLFGQRMRDDSADPDDVQRVSLQPFSGGKSRSIVLHGRPVTRLGHEGLLCVVKVGPREDAEQELERYERYVRLRMSLSRRVELLGHAMGDGLGAIAYSFAGDDPGHVSDLQELLDGSDPRALDRMAEVFADGGEWGGPSPDGPDLASFFSKAYGLRPHAVRKHIEDFADSMASDHDWQHRRNELRLPGGKLHLPDTHDIGRGLLHRSYRTAVVHGDLNASNVILAADGRSIIIDYRHTTRGPRAVDLAAMQTSVRLSAPACARPPAEAARDEQQEFRLWHHDFAGDQPWWRAPEEPPFWLASAAELMRIQALQLPDLPRVEHAATYWLYALRVFRVQAITPAARLRLLVWISALSRVLSEAQAGAEVEASPSEA